LNLFALCCFSKENRYVDLNFVDLLLVYASPLVSQLWPFPAVSVYLNIYRIYLLEFKSV